MAKGSQQNNKLSIGFCLKKILLGVQNPCATDKNTGVFYFLLLYFFFSRHHVKGYLIYYFSPDYHVKCGACPRVIEWRIHHIYFYFYFLSLDHSAYGQTERTEACLKPLL